MKKFEFFDVDKLEEYKDINISIEITKEIWGSHRYGAYVFDYPFIINHIEAVPPAKILDFGCGFGTLDFYLADQDHEIWAVDRQDTRWFMEQHKNIHFIHAELPDGLRIDIKNNYWDYVISASSIEHNPPEKIKRIFDSGMSLLKPGGLFIATMVALKEAQWSGNAYCLDNNTIKEIFDIDADFSQFDLLFDKFKTKYDYPHLPFGIVVQKLKKYMRKV